ncbi:m-phase inducer phosphatase [Lithohypha guttulata]|uniref:m-phase inducer phosphatase n=1 Tax=Lithohypha guttulata TaxID=1690604 RepID=UPI002DE1C15D|nr:m-phase inducer phosphatase [Lithohypha guttulata]KAK5098415.1 m-phase inducer phosphatase [Lithohypha guttulata]
MTTTMMMEASSPLAAMQQPMFMNRCGFGQDAMSYASFARANFGPDSFNFRDLSMMGRRERDYFSMPPPVRGSSPTASLAADLSQNMNIDRSPQYPTPRRALFGGNTLTGFQVPLTTPPVSSSSPAPVTDTMEMSPLPHKSAHTSYNLDVQSPSPEPTPTEPPFADCLTPRSSSPVQVEEMTLQLPQERRRSNPLRPSLTRAKGFSTTCVPQRSHPEAQLPSFKFGGGIPRSNPSSSLNLSEIFEASSPVSDKTISPVARPVMPPNRVRQPFLLGSNALKGSPLGQHSRKLSNPLVRPRKQFRRSLSMFEHPNEVMRHEKDAALPSLPPIADTEVPCEPQLPHFLKQPNELPRITRETMIDVLDGKYDTLYEKRVVIDCRFEYEYEGGHIHGAVNFNDKDTLTSQLFDHEQPGKALLIFHCEYSAHRAPLMAKHIRNKDRMVNEHCYPRLNYPEVYILDGGYSTFYKDYSFRCFPQNYVQMLAQEHADACEVGMGKVKQQQRTKLVRAQTFAFGQHSPSIDSSPTAAMCRSRNDDIDMDLGDFTPVPSRPAFNALQMGRTQRMFSY